MTPPSAVTRPLRSITICVASWRISAGAAERDALAFAAGELAGAAIQQVADIEQIGDALALRGIVGEAVHAAAVIEILPYVEVRKQPRILKDIADAAAVRRDVHACRRVVQRLAIQGNDTAIWPQQPCDHVDQRCFTGAGRAEQAGDAAFAGEGGFDRELAELFGDVYAQHGQFPCRRFVARRANHSDAISAPIAITMETITSRSAAASPSGVWISE